MTRKISIFIAALIAVFLAPAMAYAATGAPSSSGGWAGLLLLGAVATGAAVKLSADEDDKPDKGPDAEGDDTPEDAGLEPTGVCASCGMGNDDNAKFCNQCGASMAAQPLDAEDDDAPPSSKKPGATAPVAAKRVSSDGTIAAILGASGESLPALKTRAIDLRQVIDTAAGVFGTTIPGEIVGALLGIPEQLAAGKTAIAEQAKSKVAAEKTERWELAKRLNALGLAGRSRSSIFTDTVDEDTGKRLSVGLRPEYARMDLNVFRGLVVGLERTHKTAARRDPFVPSRENAEAASLAHNPKAPPGAEASAATVIAWAKTQPAFGSMRKQLPTTITDEEIARRLAANAATMQSRGGVL